MNYLNDGKIIKIDTCSVNGRFFLNVSGLGFDAKIAYLTKQNTKRGFLPYLVTTLKERKNYNPILLKISTNDQFIEGKYAAAVVANASMYGYYFTISPESSLQDGLFDIILIKDAPIYKYFSNSIRFLTKSLHKSKITQTIKAKQITITSNEEHYIHVDGEGYLADRTLNFSIDPLSLNIIVPTTIDHHQL